jgi:hypothetical protein
VFFFIRRIFWQLHKISLGFPAYPPRPTFVCFGVEAFFCCRPVGPSLFSNIIVGHRCHRHRHFVISFRYWTHLFRYRTGSGISTIFHSGTWLTGCRGPSDIKKKNYTPTLQPQILFTWDLTQSDAHLGQRDVLCCLKLKFAIICNKPITFSLLRQQTLPSAQ